MNKQTAYSKFALIVMIHLVIMYAIGFVMVDTVDDIYLNVNRLYMAGMMVAPMVVVMLLMMSGMFPKPKVNLALGLVAGAVFVALFVFVRQQSFVGDEQFLKSMIPHHSGAIVMCEESKISDPEIKTLCEEIVQTQKEEISRMNAILSRLGDGSQAAL